ncbi:MAG TPA: trehalose-phosphatase [Mesorhizobium sp.]|nr:trehalose-phosphatase [Mesorhizobium sp.]
MNSAIPRSADAIRSPESVDLSGVALLLDVDGTLLDIAVTPSDVVVPAMLREILGDLIESAGGAVALVSGRRIASLDDLFAPLLTPAIGGHGAEMRVAPGEPVVETSTAALDEAIRRELKRLAGVDPRLLLEDKAHSLALHYRLAPERETLLKIAVREIVASDPKHDVEVLFGKHVIDVKPTHFSKGSAVRDLMRRKPFAGRKPLFVGDDTTDESVFAIMADLKGSGFSVGRQIAGTQGTFASPRDVRSWLRQIWVHNGSGV